MSRKTHSTPRWTIICAVSNERVLNENLLRSKIVRDGAHELILQRGHRNVARAYNQAAERANGDVLIFAHQDIFLPDSFEPDLARTLHRIEAMDPHWGVLGAAGARLVKRPLGLGWGRQLVGMYRLTIQNGFFVECRYPEVHPAWVDTLDECLLVANKTNARFDEDLPYHHFFGVELCVRLAKAGRKSYTLDAFSHHNSPIKPLGREFDESLNIFFQKHKDQCPIAMPMGVVINRKNTPLRRQDHWGLLAYSARSLWIRLRRWRPWRKPPPQTSGIGQNIAAESVRPDISQTRREQEPMAEMSRAGKPS